IIALRCGRTFYVCLPASGGFENEGGVCIHLTIPNDSKEKSFKMKCLFQLKQVIYFGWNQALSCMFPVVIFASLILTKSISLPLLSRYDWLLLICLLMQVWMVYSGLETRDELKVITVFHLIGLTLEMFNVHMLSW